MKFKSLIAASLLASGVVSAMPYVPLGKSQESVESKSQEREFGYYMTAHTDGWDDKGNWIGVNIYQIAITEGDDYALGELGISGTPNIPNGSEKVNWIKRSEGFLDGVTTISELPDVFKSLKERNGKGGHNVGIVTQEQFKIR